MHHHRRDIRCQTDSLRAARCALHFQSREHHSQTVSNAFRAQQSQLSTLGIQQVHTQECSDNVV